jgi:hypothetical protein
VVRDDEFYRKKNMNHVEERCHLALEAATYAGMERLMALPGVAEAARAVDGFRWMPLQAG